MSNNVALIGLPGLAATFRAAGFTVIGGTDVFKDDANAARAAIVDGIQPTVLAADMPIVGLRPWLSKMAAVCKVCVARTEPSAGLSIDGADDIPLPSPFDDVLAWADLPIVGGDLGTVVVNVDGTVSEPEPETAAEDATPSIWDVPVIEDDDPEGVPAGGPADQVTPESVSQPESMDIPGEEYLDRGPSHVNPETSRTRWPGQEIQPPTSIPAPTLKRESVPDWYSPPPAPAVQPLPAYPVRDEQPQPQARAAFEYSHQSRPVPDVSSQERGTDARSPRDEHVVGRGHRQPEPDWSIEERRPEQRPEPPSSPQREAEHPVQADSFDADDLFRSTAPSAYRPKTRGRRPRGMVAIAGSGKGGVGKSSISVSIATAFAENGLNACLIDCNRGQGDQRRFLRMKRTGPDGAPTIYDAAIGAATYEDVILTPDVSARLRPQLLAPLPFSVVLAPPDHLADPEVVDTDVYARMVDVAREHYDVVILDTQIIEATDTSGLIDGLVVPLLSDDGWFIGLTDPSTPGVENLRQRLTALRAAGTNPERTMIVLNRVSPDLTIDEEQFGRIYTGLGSYMGHVEENSLIKNAMNAGDSPYALPQLAPMIDAICFKITGRPEFDPRRHEQNSKKRRRLFFRRK